ncbi:MAG: glycosyltransferase family 4 protein, partial [Acidobacteriota bacterium]
RMPPSSGDTETNNVLFVGNYNFVPNREAAIYIAQTLAPSLPEANFLMVGADPPGEVLQEENVSMTGYVRDLQSILETAAVCIAPLTHGSGTRLKILTYLAGGKAVVATTKASEGLDVRDDVHVLIRDDDEGFVSAIRSLLSDPDLRRRLGAEGRKLVEAKYDWRVYVPWAEDFAAEIQESARAPRTSRL